MANTALLLSTRPSFCDAWAAACAAAGLGSEPVTVEALSARTLGADAALLVDAETEELDDDDLLACVGQARAQGACVAVVLAADGQRYTALEDLLSELCAGLVTRANTSPSRVAEAFARRLDLARGARFEYLSVAPSGQGLLAILGDGSARTLARPLSATDDGSAVEAITLAEDARSAELVLSSGHALRLSAGDFTASTDDVPSLTQVDGVKLGQRLRELRQTAGLTQAELARRTGIHRPNIARVEAGRHTPSLETLARLAAAIGVPTTRVLTG